MATTNDTSILEPHAIVDREYAKVSHSQYSLSGRKTSRTRCAPLEPPGGHAIYLDAKRFCPHIEPLQFPAQAIAVGLYCLAGIRTVEIGSVMFGQGDTPADMELVRLAIPRRVHTQSHIDYVIEAIIELYAKRQELRGLRIVDATMALRHFTA